MSGANIFRAAWSFTDTGNPVGAPAQNGRGLLGSIGAGWIMTRVRARMWLASNYTTVALPTAATAPRSPVWIPKLFGIASVNTPSVPSFPSDSNIVSTAWLIAGAEHTMNSDIEPSNTFANENWRVGWSCDDFLNRNPNPVQQDIYVAWSYQSPDSTDSLYGFSGDLEIWYG